VSRKVRDRRPGKTTAKREGDDSNRRKTANGRRKQPLPSQPPDIADAVVVAKSQATCVHQFASLLKTLNKIDEFQFPSPLEESYTALLKVVDYIDSKLDQASRKLTRPLHALINALSDTLKGRRPELLQPQHRGKGAPRNQSFASVQGTLAVHLEVLIRVGVSPNAAARFIATQAASHQILDRDGTAITSRTIISWRARANDDLPTDATKIFNKAADLRIANREEAKKFVRDSFQALANRGYRRARNSE
jgi:hypothetical protein